MTSSLEASFQSAELTAQRELDKRAQKLFQDEAEIADESVRFDAQRKIALFEELANNDKLSHGLSDIMQAFLNSDDTYDALVAEALQVGIHSQKPLDHKSNLQMNNEILDKLEQAHSEANNFKVLAMSLLDSAQLESYSLIRPILAACIPVSVPVWLV